MELNNTVETNHLFPVFLKLDKLHVLLVGAGSVGFEKLKFILKHSPATQVTILANDINTGIIELAAKNSNLKIIRDTYSLKYITEEYSLVIAAVNDNELSKQIKIDTNRKGLLFNTSDIPELCDFYLSSVVTKGHLKIAISTNGKSPALAKRLKEIFIEKIPDSINDSLENLSVISTYLEGNFKNKAEELNKITAQLKEKTPQKWFQLNFKKALIYIVSVFVIMLSGHVLFSLIPFSKIAIITNHAIDSITIDFAYYMLGGFIAQMIDGALGMAYGLSATSFLLSMGVPPAASSMAVHTSEVFTSGASGFMHLRFGNVNNKLFKTILIPGVIGSIIGAYILSEFEKYNVYIKPIVGFYTLILGIVIIVKVVRKLNKRKKVKRVGLLAIAGGFLDAIGGGGWGPVVSSTLIARGKNPRIIIGSVNLAEFFVSIASSFTFITMIGLSHWQVIAGLILGGVCAAPIAAYVSKKLDTKAMMILVGVMVIIVSIRNILKGIL